MPDLQTYFKNRTDDMVQLTMALSSIESPTDDREAVNQMGARVLQELERLSATVTVHPRDEVGDILEARWNSDTSGKPLLIVSHLDTVHPIGAVTQNPVRVESGERLYGPGVCDMKAGIVVSLMAIEGLLERGEMPDRPMIVLFTSDEETGSFYSRELIQQIAEPTALTMIMEAALPDGSLKTWRKSIARFTVRTEGIAAHAGGAHEMGCNAIEEMAHQVLKLQRMTNYKLGTTINVGAIKGGTKSNVVPDKCEAQVDARALTQDEIDRVTSEILGLKPVMPGSKIVVDGGFDRPPMEQDERMVATFEQAKQIAAEYGLTLRASGTGGASDGNYTAAVGAPTLDGLGPVGDGAHSERENVVISDLSRRATLIAALVKDWP